MTSRENECTGDFGCPHCEAFTASTLPPGSPAGETAVCANCNQPIYFARHFGYSHCDTTLNSGCKAEPESSNPNVPSAVPEPVPTEPESLNEEQIRKRLFEIRDTIEDAPNAAVIFINQLLMANWLPAAPIAPAAEELIQALELIWNRYENGIPCFEEPDEQTGPLGNAVKLSFEEEQIVLKALTAAGIRTCLTVRAEEYRKGAKND